MTDMIYRSATITLLAFFSWQLVNAQQVPDHKSMMNTTWERIDELMYKVNTLDDGTTVYTPFFPAPLKELDNATVVLPGYMVPLQLGKEHHMFMLSVLPVMQCMFCGQNGIPPLVQVTLKNGKARFSDVPFKIKGRIHLNTDLEKGAEVQILDAEVVK